MAAAVIDTAFLASFASVPQPTVQALIDAPTTDLVASFLTALTAKAQDHERLKSENLRLGVELENAVRRGEVQARTLKASTDKALKEVESLRRQLNDEESTRNDLSVRLEGLQTSSSTSTTELSGLQAQIARLEKSNRDTLSLLDSKSTAHDKLAEELASQHQKTVALRREISSLEEESLAARNAVSSAKFRESSLQQEVANLKRNNDYLDNELKIKASEHTKFRKEKNAKISELQRQNEENASTIEALQRTESTLRKRLEEVGAKADDAFSKIQRLQEESSRTQESFRASLDNANRLFELQKNSADTQKRRVESLERESEEIKDQASEAVASLEAELETERQSREAIEKKVEELEQKLEDVSSISLPPNGPSTPTPGTPRPGSSHTAGTPGSVRARGGLTTTQLYSELQTAKRDLDRQKRLNEELRLMMDDHVRKLEMKEPEMQEIQGENAHLNQENGRLSSALSKVVQEKDSLRKEGRKWQHQVEGLIRESDLLRQQLRDHGAQIKILLYEVELRNTGESLSPAERQQLEQAARASFDDIALEGMSDTGRFISQRLVQFRSVAELQQQNEHLLKLTRTLGEQMEGEEAKAKQDQQQQEKAELEELRVKAARYADEVKAMVTQAESYARERDMFRRMLSHRGRLPAEGDLNLMFGESVNGAGSPPSASQAGGDAAELSRQLSDHVKVLRETQTQYDTFRKEALADRSAMKSQNDQLSIDKHELQSQIARISSQLTLAHERYDMLQNNFNFLQQEKESSQLRQQALAESAARQDIRTQQVAEELVEAKELSDSLRNEYSNLKMEKELWRRVEARLNDDNQALTEERGRLNKVVTDTQSLFNERELADSESRRKLQAQVETLDAELRESKRKLEEEIESGKNAALRREYEQDQNRTRIDDLVKSLSNTKEELIAAKTTRDQLQARVEELKIEIRSAEERAQALRPQPTPRPIVASSTNNAEPEEDPNLLSREQELGVEVADLRRELDLTKAELENAKSQVEQYKAISQSSEEQLQEVNETADQYKAEVDQIIAEKDAKVKDLEERISDISSELSESNSQLSELRASADDSNTRLEQQRAAFEAELARVKDDSERHQEAAKFHQDDLKAQAEIAQQAQQSYENEVVKHADAAKQVQELRNKYNEIKLEVSKSKADAEAARTTLLQNEESWTLTKEQYENEILEMKRRRADVDNQNKLLHQQLEGISSQISALRERRSTSDGQDPSATSTSGLQNLQEVIKYLRDEKNIVEAQYELSTQEGKRLKQQLDHCQAQLDETRLKLDQERHKQSSADSSAASHSKLMETINELNVFRESSVTLRNEARQAQAQVIEKTKQVDDLLAQIQPLKAMVRELEAERESAQGEVKLLQEDRDRWQQRTQNILHKYDRIDPAELEGLKEQITTLKRERDEALSAKDTGSGEKQTLQDKINELEAAAEAAKSTWAASREKLVEQFKGRSRELSSKIRAAEAESNELKEQLQVAQKELQAAVQARDEALAANLNPGAPADVEMRQGDEERQPNEASNSDVQSIEARLLEQSNMVSQLNDELAALRETESTTGNRIDELQTQLDAANEELRTLRADDSVTNQGEAGTEIASLQAKVNSLQAEVDAANEELASLRVQTASAGPQQSQNEHLIKLEQDLNAARAELDALRTAGAGTSATSIQAPNDGSSSADEQIDKSGDPLSKLKADLEAAHGKRMEELETTYQQRTESMRTQLTTKLKEGKASIKAGVEQEHSEALRKLQQEHEVAISQLKDTHRKELEEATKKATTDSTAPATEQATSTSTTGGGTTLNPTPEEAKILCRDNETIRGIVRRTIVNKLDEHTAKVKEEVEKQKTEELAAQKVKLEKAKEQAVLLEGKKSALKVNMFEGRCRTFQAKIEVIEKAVAETPQKPVVEVWATAKDIKAPPQAATPKPAAAPAAPAADESKANEVIPPSPSPSTAAHTSAPASTAGGGTVPTATPATTPAQESSSTTSEVSQTNQSNGTLGAPARRPSMSFQRGGGRGGRGGIPLPASRLPQTGATQAQPNQRGRGTGIPRGGSVRGRGGLNASANQFVPGGSDGPGGNKRAREDSVGPGSSNEPKRARGGGGGARGG